MFCLESVLFISWSACTYVISSDFHNGPVWQGAGIILLHVMGKLRLELLR